MDGGASRPSPAGNWPALDRRADRGCPGPWCPPAPGQDACRPASQSGVRPDTGVLSIARFYPAGGVAGPLGTGESVSRPCPATLTTVTSVGSSAPNPSLRDVIRVSAAEAQCPLRDASAHRQWRSHQWTASTQLPRNCLLANAVHRSGRQNDLGRLLSAVSKADHDAEVRGSLSPPSPKAKRRVSARSESDTVGLSLAVHCPRPLHGPA